MASDTAISARGLVKSYGPLRAVDDLALDVDRGEVLALLGPNGAGKTTTVEMLEGYRRPDAGSIRVLGYDPIRQSAEMKQRVGIMPQEGGLYPAITPREALHLFAGFYVHPNDPEHLLTLVGLRESATVRCRRLSGGQKQRLSFALALLPNPDVLFLDEPTAGMDPQARHLIWDVIAEQRARGAAVLLTTHYLEEAERLADRIAIIDAGRLVALDTPSRLMATGTGVRIRTAQPIDENLLARLPSAASVRALHDGFMVETANPSSLLVEVTTLFRDRAVPLTELRVGHGSLEDVYLQLTGKTFDS